MKINPLHLLLGLLVPVITSVASAADAIQLSASLTGNQEVPAVVSSAAGGAKMEIDPVTREFQLTVHIVGLNVTDPADDATVTAAHLHKAAAGENGGVIFPLDISMFQGDADFLVGQFSGTLESMDLGELLAGNVYVNVHTTANPGGEIRGQLGLDNQSTNQLLNFSSRGMINPGNGKAGILIGGFLIDQPGQTVLMRCIGDGLTKWGLKSLKDTALTVYDVDGNIIAQNDDWKKDGQEYQILATGFAPDRDSDAALVYDFPAGAYTVHADSKKGAGIALIDMYGITAKTVGGIIDSAAHGGENAEFTILSKALKDTGLATVLNGPGPFTLFAPTDAAFQALPAGTLESLTTDELAAILKYHLVAANLPAAALETGPLVTVQGESLTIDLTDGVMVNDARVVGADLLATNGVVHVIDKVLLPPAP